MMMVVGALAAGCGAAPAGITVEPPEASSAEPGELRPVQRGERGPDDARLLHEAEQVLVVSCMEEAGFERYPLPFVEAEAAVGFPPELYRMDEAAAADGFGAARAGAPESPQGDPNLAYTSSLPSDQQAAYDEALHGRPDQMIDIEPVEGLPTLAVVGPVRR